MSEFKNILCTSLLLGALAPASGQLAKTGPSGNKEELLAAANNGHLLLRTSGFEENKGQVVTTSGQPAPFVRFHLGSGNTNIYLLDAGIAYQFNRLHAPDDYAALRGRLHRSPEEESRLKAMESEVKMETYRMDMLLEGADTHALITTEGRSDDFTNYYRYDALDVHAFNSVVYHGVYPGIDWSIHTTTEGIEYDFIVHPGADPSLIKLRFTHHEELSVDAEGKLTHGNRLGRFTETAPVSYQGEALIPTRFALEGDLLTFGVGGYDRSKELRIDPPRVWGTYYGGSAFDASQCVDVDANGNVYLAGWTQSTSAIATAGAQQTAWLGDDDAMLVKFDPSGVRQWGTYYGGTLSDAFAFCSVSGTGIFAAGNTLSTSGIASTEPYQSTLGGDYDGLLVKFNTANGTRAWATYYGGAAEDRARCCAVDASGNVYLAGFAMSDQGIASSEFVHQSTFAGGSTGEDYSRGDGFLAKFTTDGFWQWGTYYGGASDDEITGCAVDWNGDVYIGGGTGTSSGTSIATAGSHQATIGGNADAFLAKLSTNCFRLWGTYYGGTQADYAFACTVDSLGNPYLVGDTYSTNAIASGGHQNTFGGNSLRDAFLVKFNTSGVRQWGTYYGGSDTDTGRGCTTEGNGNVYLIGETVSTNAIAFNGHQMTNGGGEVDGYLAGFTTAGTRTFGTYYGGSLRDEAYMAAVDHGHNIYLCGRTLSMDAIATVGAHQQAYGGVSDAFLVKFGDQPDCLGVPNGTALPGTPCDDQDACTSEDTWTAGCVCDGTAVPGPTMGTVGGNSPLCVGDLLNLTAAASGIGTITYLWSGPDAFGSGSQNPSINNVTVAATGTYTVTASNGCGTDAVGSIQILVNPQPTAATVGGPQTICVNTSTTGLGGNNPQSGTGTWSVVSGGTGTFSPNNTAPNATFTHTGGAGPVIVRWTISLAPCAASFANVTITIKQPPSTAITGTPQTICTGGTTAGLGGNTPTNGTGQWTVVSGGDGIFTPDPTTGNATFTPNLGSGPYLLRWTTSNAPCDPDTADVLITVNPPPSVATVGTGQTICANGTTDGLGGNTPLIGTGVWSVVSGGTGTFSNATSPNATFTHTGGAGPILVRWTISNAPCTPSTGDVTITISQPPTTASVGGAQTICVNGTTTGLGGNTATVGTGAWSVVSGGTGTFSNAATPNATFTHTGGTGPILVRWTISNAPCTASTANVTITISQPPSVATVGGAQSICGGGTTTGLGANTPTTGTGAWSVVSGGTGTFSNAASPSSTFTHTGGTGPVIVRWTISNAPCTASTANVTITINPAPSTATTGGPQTICSGGTTTGLGGNTPTSGTGAWSIVGGGTGSFANAGLPNSTFTHTGGTGPVVLRWTISNAPCTATTADVTVTINQPPSPATAGGAQTICTNGTSTGLGGSTPTIGTGAWSVVSGGTGTFSNASTANATFTHTGGAGPVVVRWTISNAPCTATSADVTITINQPPTVATTGGPQTICLNGTTSELGGNIPTVGTGAWSVVSGGTGTFSNATSPSATFTHTGGAGPVVVRWTISNAPCTASTANTNITINQPPTTATTGGPQTICTGGTTAALGGNTPSIGSGSWSVVSGGTGTFSNPGSPASTFTHAGGAGPVVLRWTISNAPCTASAANVSITINQAPTLAAAGGPQTICVNGTTNGLGGNTPTVGSGLWSVVSGGTGTFSNATSPNATFTHTGGTGPVLVRWTISNAPCVASTANVNITINQLPSVATAGTVQPICANGTTTGLGGNAPLVGIGAWSVVSGGTGTFTPNAGSPNATFTHTSGAGPVIVRWTISNVPCTATTASVTVNISPDSDGDGVCDVQDDCPSVTGELGSACDDADVLTINDVLVTGCVCQGTPVSCVADGDCNDGDPCTLDDCVSNTCVYTAITTDTDGDGIPNCSDDCPTVDGEAGSVCNDNNPCTTNDLLNGACACVGTASGDTDGDGICDALDECPDVPGGIGSICNDNDVCTVDDALNSSCICTGTFSGDTDGDGICNATDDCPTVPGEIGGPCNDGDLCTINDALNATCECAGTFDNGDTDGDGIPNCEDDCPNVPGEQGLPCDDNDPCTINDVLNALCNCTGTDTGDSDDDGICDVEDDCPDVPGEIGDACDDDEPCTIDDVLNADCQCTGTDTGDSDGDGVCNEQDDCPNVVGQAGSPCDDGNVCTVNDVLNSGCQCAGTPDNTDTDGDAIPDCADSCPTVIGQVGSACDDNNPCTVGDILNPVCQCAGSPDNTDSDGDGEPDCSDNCPDLTGQIGDACDDGVALTVDDAINGSCVCIGTPVSCTVNGDCDDQDACTADVCDNSACIYTQITADDDGDGVPDCEDPCPNVAGVPGNACDDNNPCTIGDILNPGCQCAGSPDNTDTDGDGIPNCEDSCPTTTGQVGSPCDDNDPLTVGDELDVSCVCTGIPVSCAVDGDCDDDDDCTNDACVDNACVFTPITTDTDGDDLPDCIDLCPTAFGEPGSPCDDGNACTLNDLLNPSCGCAGAPDNTDTDSDGIPDCEDSCPEVTGEIGGGCNDNDPCTTGDILNPACMCAGTPIVVGPINGPASINGFTDQTYSVPVIPGATFVWTLPDLWSSSNTTSSNLNVFTQQGPDTTELCVNAYIPGCSNLDPACVTITVLESVGISDIPGASPGWFIVRPNPSRGTFELLRTGAGSGAVHVEVRDATGRLAASLVSYTDRGVSSLDMNDASPGAYFLRASDGTGIQVVRLLIER